MIAIPREDLLLKTQIDEMTSPIRFVVRHINKIAYTIAKERGGELVPLIKPLSLHVTNGDRWEFSIRPGTGEIEISRRAMEILWSVAYGYYVVYRRIAEAKVAAGGADVVLDLTTDSELFDAVGLLRWGLYEFLAPATGSPPIEMPSSGPRPIESPEEGSNERAADELALCAAGFFLHHEIGHQVLGHQRVTGDNDLSKADSISQERDADYHAGDWILGAQDPSDQRFVKRALGIAVALVVDVARTIHADIHGGHSHPRPYDRLIHLFDRYLANDGWNVTWAFIVAALKLHFDNSPVTLPSRAKGHADFRAAVDAYVDVLAGRQAEPVED